MLVIGTFYVKYCSVCSNAVVLENLPQNGKIRLCLQHNEIFLNVSYLFACVFFYMCVYISTRCLYKKILVKDKSVRYVREELKPQNVKYFYLNPRFQINC